MTNKTPWTPGPWHLGLRQAEQIVYNAQGWAVANATVYHGEHDRDETKANARLIALAPEVVDLLVMAETALGENLVWIADQADLSIRQKDPETLARLKQLETAWHALVKGLARLPTAKG